MCRKCGVYSEEIFERLAKGFSEIAGYAGWLIVKLIYGMKTSVEKGESDCNRQGCAVKKEKSGYSILESYLEKGNVCFFIEMHLMKPRKDILESVGGMPQKASKSCSESDFTECVVAPMTFSRCDVIKFIKKVGDPNPIHQTEVPVVPGLLILQGILKVFQNQDLQKAEIQFHYPLFAGESVNLYQQQRKQKYIGVGEHNKVEVFQFRLSRSEN